MLPIRFLRKGFGVVTEVLASLRKPRDSTCHRGPGLTVRNGSEGLPGDESQMPRDGRAPSIGPPPEKDLGIASRSKTKR